MRWAKGKPRLLLLAVLGASVLTATGSAASAAPPTEPELLTGLSGQPGTVPGLVTPVVPTTRKPGTKSSKPTAQQCVAVWNARAPAETKRWVRARSASRADVTLLSLWEQTIGSPSVRYVYWQCVYGIAVGPRQIVMALAPPVGTTSPWRGELLRYRTQTTVSQLVERFNASMDGRGNLRLS